MDDPAQNTTQWMLFWFVKRILDWLGKHGKHIYVINFFIRVGRVAIRAIQIICDALPGGWGWGESS